MMALNFLKSLHSSMTFQLIRYHLNYQLENLL